MTRRFMRMIVMIMLMGAINGTLNSQDFMAMAMMMHPCGDL
ncbi:MULTISPECIES: hypothetical protein [Saccharospirillaceae]